MALSLAVLAVLGLFLLSKTLQGQPALPGDSTQTSPQQPAPGTEPPPTQQETPPPAEPQQPAPQPEPQQPTGQDALFTFETVPQSADISLTRDGETREALGLQNPEELQELARELELLAPQRDAGITGLEGSWTAHLTLTLGDGSQRIYQFCDNGSDAAQSVLLAAPQGGNAQGYRSGRGIASLRQLLEGMVRAANQQEAPFLIQDALDESTLVVYDNGSRLLVSAGEQAGEIATALARLEVIQLEEGTPVGSPLTGAAEMRLIQRDLDYAADSSTTYTYTLYEDGVLVSDGYFYRCTPDTVRELAAVMEEVYRQGKPTPAWLGIMTLEKYDSMVVYSAATGTRRHVALLFEESTGLFQALKELHVERDSLETVRTVPEEGEYYLTLDFNTDVTYHIGIQDGYLYLDSTDMREGLRYRLVEDEQFRQFETLVEYFIPRQDQEGNRNPLTAKPVLYLSSGRGSPWWSGEEPSCPDGV